jgi:predicted O-methyltransferase YrrM
MVFHGPDAATDEEMSAYIPPSVYHTYEPLHPYYQGMMDRMVAVFKLRLHGTGGEMNLLELGAGTGIFTRKLAEEFPEARLTAVEVDGKCFEHLAQTLRDFKNVECVRGDSVTYVSRKAKFDGVFSSFSDHHIRPARRSAYFENVRDNLLKKGGAFIVGDEFLRKHRPDDYRDWRAALQAYHHHIIEVSEMAGPDGPFVADLERLSLASGLKRRGDFKMSRQIYEELLKEAGFKYHCELIGPVDQPKARDGGDVGGIYVYTIQ